MAAEFKIGRLRYNWAGAWSPATVYARDSVVQYQGQAYVCLVPNTSNSNFYNDLYATPLPYWTQMTSGHTFAGTWSPSTLYSLNNLVIFDGTVYQCAIPHTSSVFSTDLTNGNWTVYVQENTWLGPWTTNTTYAPGGLVTYGGITYKCITSHVSASTTTLGLEANQSDWSVWYNGVAYLGPWQSGYRYKTNDLVKVDSDIYICLTGHTSESPAFTGSSSWNIWIPGQDFELIWSSSTVYQLGDAVVYSGDAYISTIAHNLNNIPSSLSGWTKFNVGYNIRGVWNSANTYGPGDVVTVNGCLYEAIANNINQDPSAYTSTTTYNSTGSSGTTLVVASTTNIVAGMIVIGTGFTLGQVVSSVTNSTTLVLTSAPDGVLTNGETLTFAGVNNLYWTLLVGGTQWRNRWIALTSYKIGDIVVWANATYSCVQDHVATVYIGSNGTVTGNRPDADATRTYWKILVDHDRNNALNSFGDIETYTTGPGYSAVPIGTNTYNLRVNVNVPNWQKINVVPNVYYVDTNSGIDTPSYGVTWDQPWKTIKYACNYIGQGQYYANATALLQANKGWLITEMYQWMLYQCNNNIAPFSTTSLFDPFYTQRDAGYLVDAVIYDMQRGGNSQIVAATLRWFYYGSSTQFANQLIESAIAYFAPSITYLQNLMVDVISNSSPSVSYQTLNGITGSSYVNQYINNTLVAEQNAAFEITSLMSIPITAVTNQNTYSIPASNTGLTAILNIKTGTYNESLPIIVPENLSIVGDELRSVTVQPAVSLEFYATSTSSVSNAVTVSNVSGLTDQMPIQFISPYVNNASTSFESNINPGQTYYVIGSSISGNSFQITNAATQVFTGTTVIGSNVISNASQITNLIAGMKVTGTGIPANTVVVSVTQAINSIAQVTLSNAATVSGILQTFTATGATVTFAGGTGSMLCYAGDCLKDMWYMLNGTTMRNLSNFGLVGQLSAADAYGISRPTGGRYTSLCPGKGPDDTSVWIIRRSPYVQNVTNFGTACIGTMSDGSLHNGGTKAMLHNDYTQVLSDGIGVWIANSGAISECVSVFSYYCYIGHYATGGGRIRSTNGNSSYGTYGVVSEGYDVNEVPATGTIFNQSTQVQASVAQAFGTTNNILKLNYTNAGSGYYLPCTNMIQYSNNFVASVWSNDGNISFIKNEVAPTGFTEAWLLTGSQSIVGSGYIQQSVSINPTGYVYTNVSGTTLYSQPGTGASFNITVTATAYTATVYSSGSLYAVTNQILIKGSQLGGVDGTNDCTITVGSLSGTGILSLSSVTGTVPTGSAQNYTLSIYVYAGTSSTVDLQAIFSGNTTAVSGISYNVKTNTTTPYAGTSLGNSTNAGVSPTYYGANKTLVAGWYKIWLSVYDSSGLNNTLTFKFFPQGANAPVAGTYSIVYGSQLELSGNSPSPNFYLETTSSMFTAAANFEVVGNGSGALLSGDEIRSGASFNARITTDSNGYTGGSGYATASNTAQAGTPYSITLSNADPGTSNYIGMRVFIQSGTGAGQFGYITYYNKGSTVDSNGVGAKVAYVCVEDVEQVSVVQTTYSSTAANNLLTLATGTDLSKYYVNQIVQFTPTYYTSVISSTSVGVATAIATAGGVVNTITMASVADLELNMSVTFQGSGFNITPGYTYYIVSIDYTNSLIQVSNVIYGTPIQLSTVSASENITMTMNYSNYSGYLTSQGTGTVLNVTSITSTTGVFGGTGFNLSYGQQVTITGNISGGGIVNYVEGTTYYVIGSPTSTAFQLSATYPGPGITPTPITTVVGNSISGITVTAYPINTANMLPNIAIQFTGIALGGITLGNTYYIQDIIDSNNFTISVSQLNLTSTASTGGVTNTISATTSSMVPLNPVVFGGTIFDASLTANTTYYISNIVNSSSFQIATSIIRTTATQTYYTTNLIQISTSVANFVVGQPIIFSGILGGTTFGNIVPETVYYILTTNTSTNQITISTDKVNPFSLVNAGGTLGGVAFVRTCPAAAVLGGGTGSMTITSTGTKLAVTNSVVTTGTMNGTYQTSLIGGVNSYTRYYITAINSGSSPTFSVSTTLGGTPITLANAIGNMQMGVSGWDNINPGTPSVSLFDSTTNYFIEPRLTFSAPSWSQTVGSMSTPLSTGLQWQGIAYGNNYFLAIPSSGQIGAQSSNGLNWSSLVLPSTVGTWSSIAYGNFYWIALGTTSGSLGTSVAAYSNSNGTGWRLTSMPSNANWSNICYGNGRFVAITTGTPTWTQVSETASASSQWIGIASNGTLWVAVSEQGPTSYSSNGSTWTSGTNLDSLSGQSGTTWNDVTYDASSGYFVAVSLASSGNSYSAYSANGSSWTLGGSMGLSTGNFTSVVSNGAGKYASVASGTSTVSVSSNHGTSWSTYTLPSSANWSGVAYGNGIWVAISTGGLGSNTASYSIDGVTWNASTMPTTSSWVSITYGNGTFVAITSGGNTATSSNGFSWASHSPSVLGAITGSGATWASIRFANGIFVATSKQAVVAQAAATSLDGITWIAQALPSVANWVDSAYNSSLGQWVAISGGSVSSTAFALITVPSGIAAYSTNFGATWNASSTGLLANKTWVGLSYGLELFLAIASDGTGAWSYDGNVWQATSLPASTISVNTGITITGSAGSFSLSSALASQMVVGQTVTISGTNSGTGTVVNGTYSISATNGSTTFTLVNTNSSTSVVTSSGNITGLTFTFGASSYSGLAYGDNRFLAIQNGVGQYSAFSFNGISWYQSQTYITANNVAYGQGRFVATQNSGTTEYNSHAGVYWTQRTLTYGNINALGFGFSSTNVGVFPALSGTGSSTGSVTGIYEGQRTQGRATVSSGAITSVTLFEPGSNYSSAPSLTFTDFNSQVTAQVTPRISNGTLGNPSFISRGTGYNTTSTSVTITGNGYADTYQTGYTLIINNLSTLPLVGSNLTIAGISQVFKVTSATAVYGTVAPYIEANVQVSPTVTTALSPSNGTLVSIRQLYSQVRLTNHDFLSIGVGNAQATNYPNVNEANALPNNEAVEVNQGHVFWTSTDENGNFEVGSLFGVQQSTGTVTLSATQFGLQGLNQLSLGGIAVGSNQVIISQFSTDPTFVANSDSIIPTQKAIKSFLTGRLSQGGSNTYTGEFIAGTVEVGGPNYITSTIPAGQTGSVVKMKNKVNIAIVPGSINGGAGYGNIGVAGEMVALDRLISTARNKTEFAQDFTSMIAPMQNGF